VPKVAKPGPTEIMIAIWHWPDGLVPQKWIICNRKTIKILQKKRQLEHELNYNKTKPIPKQIVKNKIDEEKKYSKQMLKKEKKAFLKTLLFVTTI